MGATSLWHSTGFVEHADYFRAEPSNDLPTNLDAYYPRPIFGSDKNKQTQSGYLQDASYIRLKNLQFGYTLPVSLTKKFAVSKLRIFVSGENLWTGTSLTKIFDPETIGGGDEYQWKCISVKQDILCGIERNLIIIKKNNNYET